MMKMSFLKKTNIPQILFSVLVLSSCGKDKNNSMTLSRLKWHYFYRVYQNYLLFLNTEK